MFNILADQAKQDNAFWMYNDSLGMIHSMRFLYFVLKDDLMVCWVLSLTEGNWNIVQILLASSQTGVC